jgi:hypothetical protein
MAMAATPLKGHAARYLNSLSIHPPVLVREKRRDHRSDIVWHSRTPQRSHLRYALVHFRIVAHHAGTEIRLDRAGCDDIGGDPTRAEFFGQIASEHLDSTFRGSIGGAARQSEPRESGRYVYYSAAIVHQGKKFLREEVNTLDVNIENLIELDFRCFVEAGMQRIAGVVYKVVEPVQCSVLRTSTTNP